MCRALSRLLLQQGIAWDHKQRHIPCMAHIIHNNVKAFLTAIKAAAADDDNFNEHHPDLRDILESDIQFGDLLNKCRGLAKKIRTPQGWELFQKICKTLRIKPLKILLDAATRWGTTHRMLERVLYLREAVRRFTFDRDDCDQFMFTDAEWGLLELICGFLWPFRWATEALESSEKPELDRVFWIYNKLFSQIETFQQTLKRRETRGELWATELLEALDKMYEHLRKYYRKVGQPVYSDSMILHPRIKLKLFDTADWNDGDAEHYRKICRDNYDANYANLSHSDIRINTPYMGLSQKRNTNALEDEYDQYLNDQLSTESSGHELDMYLLAPTVLAKCSLDYWRCSHLKYPHLGMMARDVLAVPPSGSGVEREFSIAGRVATWQRSRLHAETITAIMIYKNYLKRCRRDIKLDIHFVETASLGTEEDVEAETQEEEEEATKTIEEWRQDWRAGLDGLRGTRRF